MTDGSLRKPKPRAQSDVAVALIVNAKREILLVYNPEWGTFSLPMTKRRKCEDKVGGTSYVESPEDAAARAAVEVMGRACFVEHVDVPDDTLLQIGHCDGLLKEYRFRVYRVTFGAGGVPPLLPGCVGQWLPVSELIAEEGRRPLSTAVLPLIECLRQHASPRFLAP